MHYIFGENSLKEMINKKVHVKKVYLAKNKVYLQKYLIENRIKYEVKDNCFFNKFADDLNHQYIVSEIEINNLYYDLKQYLNTKKYQTTKKHIFLILDKINDARNFGSIIRTSYALGVNAIIFKKDNQVQLNDYVAKTSMGSCYLIDLINVTNLNQSIDFLKQNNFWIYASNISTNAINFKTLKYDDENIALIVGNEQNGISELVLKKSDFNIYIPMNNNFNSLNVSVATGILLSEIIFKQNK